MKYQIANNDVSYTINIREPDPNWECKLFGMEDYIFVPTKGNVPNWFWRQMQYLMFGCKWVRKSNPKVGDGT